MPTKKSITIIGAGLVGSLLGIFLVKKGYLVTIYERRSDMRKSGTTAGRSINLALSDRGLLALQQTGISEDILQIAIPMHGRQIHHPDGSGAFQPYGREGQYINSVSRGELNKQLMTIAENEGVQIFFERRCEEIDWQTKTILFSIDSTPATEEVNFDLLFAADGAFSAGRLQHQLHHSQCNYQQFYIDCGYKELTIPAGTDAAGNAVFALEPNALHIWPRKDYMLIALPNPDKTFTCTLFFPMKGELSFEGLDTKPKVEEFFRQNFPDLQPHIASFTDDFFQNPVSTLVTVKCDPWIRRDHFALIGDAAHAIVPFFGQGMNCGFEDCRILSELIDLHKGDWPAILQAYQELRKPDADAIADLAILNFTEMRERTADPKFLLQK